MNKVYLFLIAFLLTACSAQKAIPVSEEDANYKNAIDSEVRSLRFRNTGAGTQVEIIFRDPVSGGGLTIDKDFLMIQCNDLKKWSGNRLSYDHASFPFHFYIKYRILVLSGTSRESRNCEFELTINKPGNWRVEVNH